LGLPILRDFAMPADLVDPGSGISGFEAVREIVGMAASGQDILTLGSLPYWENLFPGWGPTGANGGCLWWDFYGVDPGFACGFTPSQVAFDWVIGWHGEGTPGDTANASTGFGTSTAWEGIDYGWGPGYLNCASGVDLDGDPFPDCEFAFFPGQYVALNAWTGIARSEYHAMQLSVRKRMSHGLQFTLNYTLSHSLDHSSTPERATSDGWALGGGVSGLLINGWEPDTTYGDSDFDMRHQLNTHWVYELPIGRGKAFGSGMSGWANQILGGWEISGIFRYNSGLPATFQNGRTWPTNWNITPNAHCAPVGSHPLGLALGPCPATQNAHGATHTGGAAGNTVPNIFADPDAAINAFRFSAAGEVGNRNVLRGDIYTNLDFGVIKTFNMPWEGHSFQFRWEMFNVFNSVYFDTGYLNGSIGSVGTFGDYNLRRLQSGVGWSSKHAVRLQVHLLGGLSKSDQPSSGLPGHREARTALAPVGVGPAR
jgi:hypothetical protein